MSSQNDLNCMFEAEDLAGRQREAQAIRSLAEKIYISSHSSAGDFTTPEAISYCFHAAKAFIEHEESL